MAGGEEVWACGANGVVVLLTTVIGKLGLELCHMGHPVTAQGFHGT